MSLGQSSYYEAKVFLKALIDAHRVLEQEAIQKAKIDRLKYYEKAILSGVNSGHFKLNGQSISKTSTFNNSRIFEASQFVKNYFSKNFSDFNKLKSANQLAISFEKNLK